jgi:hypothetical protein
MIQEKDRIIEFKCGIQIFRCCLGYLIAKSVSYIVYIIFVNLKYWTITLKFEGLYNAGVF